MEYEMKLIKAAKLLIKYFVMYLSMLMPRDKKIMVFGAWLGDKFADNSKMLFLEAQKDKDIEAVWIAKSEKTVNEVRNAGFKAFGWSTPKGIWYQLRAGYAVMTNGISDFNHTFLGGAVFINLWHGIPLKKIGYDDYYEKDWDSRAQKLRQKIVNIPLGREYVVATSPAIANVYTSAFRVPKKRVLILGQPRNDVFFDLELRRAAFGSAAGGENGRIRILYAPTHRKEGKVPIKLSEIFDLEILNIFCEENNCDFIVKKHFYHRDEREDLKKFGRIRDITGEEWDTQKLLMMADVLVTDYSSIYIDYLLLDRPMLFYNYDYEEYLKSDREMYFRYEDVTPGERAGNFEEFLKGLGGIIRNVNGNYNGRAFHSGSRFFGENAGECYKEDGCCGNGDYYKEERKKARDFFYCRNGQKAVGYKLLNKIKKIR